MTELFYEDENPYKPQQAPKPKERPKKFQDFNGTWPQYKQYLYERGILSPGLMP